MFPGREGKVVVTKKWLPDLTKFRYICNLFYLLEFQGRTGPSVLAPAGSCEALPPTSLCKTMIGLPYGHHGLPVGHPGLPFGHQDLSFCHQGLPFGHQGLSFSHQGLLKAFITKWSRTQLRKVFNINIDITQ